MVVGSTLATTILSLEWATPRLFQLSHSQVVNIVQFKESGSNGFASSQQQPWTGCSAPAGATRLNPGREGATKCLYEEFWKRIQVLTIDYQGHNCGNLFCFSLPSFKFNNFPHSWLLRRGGVVEAMMRMKICRLDLVANWFWLVQTL